MDEPTEELKRQQEKYRKHAHMALDDIEQRIRRVVLTGNAGGIIATLTLIGALLGSGRSAGIPAHVLWLVAVFMVGLFSILLSDLIAWFYRGARYRAAWDEDEFWSSPLWSRVSRGEQLFELLRVPLVLVSTTCLIGGSIAGVVILHGFTL